MVCILLFLLMMAISKEFPRLEIRKRTQYDNIFTPLVVAVSLWSGSQPDSLNVVVVFKVSILFRIYTSCTVESLKLKKSHSSAHLFVFSSQPKLITDNLSVFILNLTRRRLYIKRRTKNNQTMNKPAEVSLTIKKGLINCCHFPAGFSQR